MFIRNCHSSRPVGHRIFHCVLHRLDLVEDELIRKFNKPFSIKIWFFWFMRSWFVAGTYKPFGGKCCSLFSGSNYLPWKWRQHYPSGKISERCFQWTKAHGVTFQKKTVFIRTPVFGLKLKFPLSLSKRISFSKMKRVFNLGVTEASLQRKTLPF